MVRPQDFAPDTNLVAGGSGCIFGGFQIRGVIFTYRGAAKEFRLRNVLSESMGLRVSSTALGCSSPSSSVKQHSR
jgi:hypothetical protein